MGRTSPTECGGGECSRFAQDLYGVFNMKQTVVFKYLRYCAIKLT